MPATWRERLLYWWTCFLVLFKAPVKPARPTPAAIADAHPCTLCRCPGGPDLPPEEHRLGCEWAGVLCQPCKGLGRCARCGGSGVRPGQPDTGCPSPAEAARRMATRLRSSVVEMARWQEFFCSDAPATAAAFLDDYANLDEQLQRALTKIRRLEASAASQRQGDLAP